MCFNETFIYLLVIAVCLYVLFYGTWFFYIAFMGIKTHKAMLKAKLGLVWRGLYPLFAIALLMDVLFNIVIGTMYFKERPKEWLFTGRCSRHLNSTGERLRKAQFVCDHLLNPFENGHC